MADTFSAKKRSEIMSRIGSKNTKPEITIRKALHARGFRYRIHDTRLPGKPDIVFPKRKAVIFINGCFWHGHNCHLFKWPATRPDFWKQKIKRNQSKDAQTLTILKEKGWRVLVVWECAVKGKKKLPLDLLISDIATWLGSEAKKKVIEGADKPS